MPAPASTEVPRTSGNAPWVARLRRFGKAGLLIVLLGIGALWCHELFADANVRQSWKLYVLIILIPLGVIASLSLGIAWLLHRPDRETR